MCIIVVKNKNINKLPQEKYLKNCFENNSEGAGFMYTYKGKVVIDKGYMNYKDFLKHYNKLCRKFNDFKNKSLIMHFRIGTAGTNSKENTHPYPVTDSISLLHKTYIKTDLGVTHNGIIHDYNPTKQEKKLDINDTQSFIIKYIYPLYSHYKDFYKNEYILKGMEDITGSRLAFLDKNDIISLVGEFDEDEDGILYSNDGYKTNYMLSYTYYSPHSSTNTIYDYDYNYENHKKEDTSLYDLELDSNWYICIEGKEFEKVGDRQLIFDYYDYALYEIKNGKYEFISEDVEIYDENGEEIIL